MTLEEKKVGQQVHTWGSYPLPSSKWFTTTEKLKSWIKVFSTEFALGPTTHGTLVAIILDNSSKIPKFGDLVDVEGKPSNP